MKFGKNVDMDSLKLGTYQHYKGNLYQVLGLGRHTETEEPMVVYQALYGDYKLWIRPLSLFLEPIEKNEKKVPRFKFIKPLFS